MTTEENFDPYGLRQVLNDKIDFDNWMRDNGGNFKEARNLAFAAWQASRRLYAQAAIGIPISAVQVDAPPVAPTNEFRQGRLMRCGSCGAMVPPSNRMEGPKHWHGCPLADRT